MSKHEKDGSTDEALALRADIEHTRADMTATVAAIEHRLDPALLGKKAMEEIDHVEAKVKEAVRAQFEEARGIVKNELTEAKAAVRQELSDAKTAVKKDIQDAIQTAKQSVREATFGRMETLATQAGDAMNDTRETLVETMKLNPIPTAIVGVGLVWLLMNRSSADRRRKDGASGNGYPYGGGWQGADVQYANGMRQVATDVEHAAGQAAHRVGDVAGQVAHRAGDFASSVAQGVSQATSQVGHGIGDAATAVNHAMHDARDMASSALHQGVQAASSGFQQTSATAGKFAHDAGDAMVHLGQGAQHIAGSAVGAVRSGAQRTEQGFESVLEKNPLALGAAAALVGMAVGFALPRTTQEDALMGGARDKARDKVIEKATGMAGDAVHSLEHLAASASTDAKQAFEST